MSLKRQVWDLEEGLKEKDTVGLASASLAAKCRGWRRRWLGNRKHGDSRLLHASLEEEVAQVGSSTREEKILLEARIVEDEELKISAEDRIV